MHERYENQKPDFARIRARILQILHDDPRAYRGLTYVELGNIYYNRWKYRPTIGNRIRELRSQGLVITEMKRDLHGRERIHVFAVD